MVAPTVTQEKYLQSIWPIVQEKQRKTQREEALGSHEADPSGKVRENSPWAPFGIRDVLPQHSRQGLRPSQPLLLGPLPAPPTLTVPPGPSPAGLTWGNAQGGEELGL